MGLFPKYAYLASPQILFSSWVAISMLVMSQSTTTRVHYPTCPVCGSEAIKPLFDAMDHTVSQETFSVWGCRSCQARFTQDIPDEAHIGPYYQSDAYISHSNTSQGLINQLYQRVRRYTLQQKHKLVRQVSKRKQGRLLDYGCGTGDFAGTMQLAGWDVLGLEPDSSARKLAAERHDLAVAKSDHLFQLDADRFDVITMWHVLEHVHRLHDTLDQLHTVLRPDGVLLVAVPNYQSGDAAHYGENWAAYDVPRHLYHFSPPAMQCIMEQHGFHVEQYRRMPFDSFYVSLLSERYQRGRSRLLVGGWHGLRSFTEALFEPKRCSSVLYVIRPAQATS